MGNFYNFDTFKKISFKKVFTMGRIIKLFIKSVNLNNVLVAILIITMVTIIGFSKLGILGSPRSCAQAREAGKLW